MEQQIQNAAHNHKAAFFSLVNHPFKFRLYLLKNLPSAFFSGLKIEQANEESCTVSVPFQWFTKNPFRSTYFACLSMGAELSTGVLAMANVYKRKPSVSMLVMNMEARFYKKANESVRFTCSEGAEMEEAIATAVSANKGQEIKVYSVGKNSKGEVVAEFWFTWSFKKR